MSSINRIGANYVAPVVVMCEVHTENGFNVSTGAVIEQIGGRLEDESWG